MSLGEGVRDDMVSKRRALKRRAQAFGLTLIAVLALGGGAAGSASALSVEGTLPQGFALAGGSNLWKISDGSIYQCTKELIVGQFVSSTEAEYSVKFEGCKMGTSVNCNSAGQAKGVIVTQTLKGKLVYLDAAKTRYGFLPTSSSGNFAEFSCTILVHGVVSGELPTEITGAPLDGKLHGTFGLTHFEEFMQVEGAGPKHELKMTVNEGSPQKMYFQGSESGAFNGGHQMKFLP